MFDLEEFRGAKLPSENEIMETWLGDFDNPVISIICTSYNQEDYIKDAIYGFLIQKTKVPFEIVIHDDASVDNTSKIIKYYAELYPRIIKPILQIKNQYSINGHLPFYNSVKSSLGEFISLCEGDDFWICSDKLQSQYQLLVSNPNIDLCFTSALLMKDEVVFDVTANYKNAYKVFSVSDIIEKGGSFIPTASIFLRAKVLNYRFFSIIKDAPVGDYYVQIFGSLNSGAIFQKKSCSVYRVNSAHSWSSSVKKSDNIIKIKDFLNGNEITLLKILEENSFLEKPIKYSISNFYLSAAKRSFKLGLIEDSRYFLNKIRFSCVRWKMKDLLFYFTIKILPIKLIHLYFIKISRKAYGI